jgi:hypothetical protein
MHRRLLAVTMLSAAAALGGIGFAQDDIRPLPRREQEVTIVTPSGLQQVERVDQAVVEQQVRPNEVPTPAKRTASAVGKVAVGVLAAAVAIGASAASLLFL